MSEYQEVDNIEISSTKKFDDIICETERRISECRHHKIPLDAREFEQFKKSWFYHNWYHRFARLGNVGVISIPNTTLEEWIYWLYEFSIKFTDDYNKFKKLVWEAIRLHEEHLTILDNKVKDLEERVTELERQVQLIWQKINEILEQINQIWQNINQIKNDIEKLKEKDQSLQDQFDSFKANVFSVSYQFGNAGTLQNGWTMKHENNQEAFGFIWGWNNPQDHSQGVHYQLLLNYLYKTGVFVDTMVGESLIGTIPVPQEMRDAGFSIVENWLYAGYITQSSKLVGNVFIHLVPNGNNVDIKIMNTVHTGWADLQESTEWQINTGGAPTLYAV